jgi:serine-type D-Ala-D-Ala carboxypeptidase (penicillin-binding protein 5/6)
MPVCPPRPLAVKPLVLALGLMLASVIMAAPAGAADLLEVNAPQAILIDAATGAVLFEKAADAPAPPASMAKLMTLELVFRALKDGRLKFEDEFPVSANAYKKGGEKSGATTMFLAPGASARVADLVSGIAVASANDACIAIAEGMAGSETAFADLMTQAGKDIGMSKAKFTNPTGLPDAEMSMSVRELALLAQHLIREYPDYYSYFAQRNFSYNNKLLLSKNPLLSANIGVDGLKTGASADGGQGIVASAVQDGRRLIVVLNGEKSEADRASDARRLFDHGVRGFKEATVFDAGEIISTARVWGGTQWFVPVLSDSDVRILVPRGKNDSSRLKAALVYQGPLKAPIRKGETVGYLRVETADGIVSRVPLKAGADVGRSGVLARGLDSILVLGLGWALK